LARLVLNELRPWHASKKKKKKKKKNQSAPTSSPLVALPFREPELPKDR
jgi:hypothetical protein